MAVTQTVLGTKSDVAAAPSATITDAEYTNPTGGTNRRLAIYFIVTKGSGSYTGAVSVAGGGVTWSSPVGANPGGPRSNFRAHAVSGTPDGSDITVTVTGDSTTISIKVVEWSDVHATSPVGRIWVQGSGLNATSLLIPHMAVEDADDVVMAFLFGGFGGDDVTWPEGTEIWDLNHDGTAFRQAAAIATGGFGSDARVTPSWTQNISNMSIVEEWRQSASTPVECDADPVHVNVAADTDGDIVTAAFSPEAGDVAVVVAAWETASGAAVTEPTQVIDNQGTPATWSEITGARVSPDTDHALRLYSKRYASAPGSIAVTIDFSSAGHMDRGIYWVLLLKNPQGSTDTDWAGAVDTDSAAAGTSLTGLSIASPASGSGLLVAMASDNATEDFVAPDGFVCIEQLAAASGDIKGFGSSEADAAVTLGVYWCAGIEELTPVPSKAASADIAGFVLAVLGTSAGGQSVELVQASESDTATGPSPSKLASLALAAETDTGQVLSPSKVAAIAQATEADTANGLTSSKLVALAQAFETDVGQTVAPAKLLSLLQGAETDTAGTLAASRLAELVRALETDTAGTLSIGQGQTVTLEQLVEIDVANVFEIARTLHLLQVAESDTLSDLEASKWAELVQALETDQAFTLSTGQGQTTVLEQVVETDAAFALAAQKLSQLIGVVETDTAGSLVPGKLAVLTSALEADLAQALTVDRVVLLVQALESDVLGSLALSKLATLARASELDVVFTLALATASGLFEGDAQVISSREGDSSLAGGLT